MIDTKVKLAEQLFGEDVQVATPTLCVKGKEKASDILEEIVRPQISIQIEVSEEDREAFQQAASRAAEAIRGMGMSEIAWPSFDVLRAYFEHMRAASPGWCTPARGRLYTSGDLRSLLKNDDNP